MVTVITQGLCLRCMQKSWAPQEMCAEMVIEDYKAARRLSILKDHGLELPVALED